MRVLPDIPAKLGPRLGIPCTGGRIEFVEQLVADKRCVSDR